MKRYNLSEIMKRAWEIKKENNENIFAICLKMAWAEAKGSKELTIEELHKLADSIDSARVSIWTKYGKQRIYVNYDNRKFYIDFDRKAATYGVEVRGNICIIKRFLEEAGINYKPLESTYDAEIKLA